MKLDLNILYIILTVKEFPVVYKDLIIMTVDREELLFENIFDEEDLTSLKSIGLDYSQIQKIILLVCNNLVKNISLKVSEETLEYICNKVSKNVYNRINEQDKTLKRLLDNHKDQTKEYIINIKKELREQITTEITTVVITTFSEEFKEFKEVKGFKPHDIDNLITKVRDDVSEIKGKLSTNFFVAITSVISILTGILLIYNKLPNFQENNFVSPMNSPLQKKNVPSNSFPSQQEVTPPLIPSP